MKILTLVLASVLLSACISNKESPNISYYSLENAMQSSPSQEASNTVLRVMPVSIVSQYAGKDFVYRTSETSYISDPYRQFLLAPSLQVTQYLTNTLQGSVAATIVNADSLLIANYVVQFNVSQLYADYQNKNAPLALTAINALLYCVTPTGTTKVGEKTFIAEQAITPNDASSLIDGYNKNLTAISDQAETWLAQQIDKNSGSTAEE